jgi:hypothetical protein
MLWFMAYGSAIKMFGLPDYPYDTPQPETETATKNSLVKSKENYTLAISLSTEREFWV